jgi:hypothetical protein
VDAEIGRGKETCRERVRGRNKGQRDNENINGRRRENESTKKINRKVKKKLCL